MSFTSKIDRTYCNNKDRYITKTKEIRHLFKNISLLKHTRFFNQMYGKQT